MLVQYPIPLEYKEHFSEIRVLYSEYTIQFESIEAKHYREENGNTLDLTKVKLNDIECH